MAKRKGLWANIHAKRKRGERPAKPGEKGYPKTLDIMKEGGSVKGRKKLKGMLRGPSHENGGIKFTIDNQIQEAEGGEYVIRKSSVNDKTERVLKYINENGKLPKSEFDILPSSNAKKRRK